MNIDLSDINMIGMLFGMVAFLVRTQFQSTPSKLEVWCRNRYADVAFALLAGAGFAFRHHQSFIVWAIYLVGMSIVSIGHVTRYFTPFLTNVSNDNDVPK